MPAITLMRLYGRDRTMENCTRIARPNTVRTGDGQVESGPEFESLLWHALTAFLTTSWRSADLQSAGCGMTGGRSAPSNHPQNAILRNIRVPLCATGPAGIGSPAKTEALSHMTTGLGSICLLSVAR